MSSFTWPASWKTDLDELHRRLLLRELHRELPPGHALTGHTCTPLAVLIRDSDWVAMELKEAGYAAVHLTWNKESDPRWPHTEFFKSLEELCRPGEWE